MILFSPTGLTQTPAGSAYLDGGNNKVGVILCHGKGKHPTWKVVEPLRVGIHLKLGYHTLSIQMPNQDKDWQFYTKDFPDAYAQIEYAIDFLKHEKGVSKLFLMGHSMGSRMASSFMRETKNQSVDGLIIAGCRNNGGKPFNCKQNVKKLELPILDIWGGANEKDADSASQRKRLQSDRYRQVVIPGANHKFDGYETELVTAVTGWLQDQ